MYPVDPANGYRVRARDLEFLGYSEEQLGWWQGKAAPNGLTPGQFREFRTSLLDALRGDGIAVDSVEAFVKGSSVTFFGNTRKSLPTAAELTGLPEAKARLDKWLGDDPDRPRSRLFDAMHRLGLEQPSDVDLVISSDEMVRRVRERFASDPAHGLDDYLHPKYRFVRKALMNETFPGLADWAERWQGQLGREVTPAVFGLREEEVEPPDLDQGVRWKIAGPEALPLGSAAAEVERLGGRRSYEDVLRVAPPVLPSPPESAALRGNQVSAVDRALLRFLDAEVNLSADAYRVLGERVGQVHQAFTADTVFSANENRLLGQGSCFFGTAIQPVAGRGLDVDVLLELPYRADWEPRRYLTEAERALRESGVGADAVERQSRNVRIDFPGEVHVDVVPMVMLPSGEKAIVNFDEDAFQPVDPAGMAEWIDQQDERSGGSLRPVVRLLKYARAMDGQLPCAPISLTVMLGEQVRSSAEITRDSGLTGDLSRLVDGLCEATASPEQKPRIVDPSRPEVNFDHRWKWGDYQQFRVGIRDYRERLTTALRTDPEGLRPEVWTPVFGREFARYLEGGGVEPASSSESEVGRRGNGVRRDVGGVGQGSGDSRRDAEAVKQGSGDSRRDAEAAKQGSGDPRRDVGAAGQGNGGSRRDVELRASMAKAFGGAVPTGRVVRAVESRQGGVRAVDSPAVGDRGRD
ncbi:nucleotidyltransferase domain-containing protein [Kribbella sp. CA-293567]|uniref:nucleotidyltransferase domain-containing protein n=1 Tax=Kribbella sp. CA-293567 TaxID=3002436 RepID=UPI0022DD6376|nr:nucleotidyltransferase [Kribbella sp. CA-293567]WBQ02274.1 nucleotidyltransferase [Kribbella sp. CA-293567]